MCLQNKNNVDHILMTSTLIVIAFTPDKNVEVKTISSHKHNFWKFSKGELQTALKNRLEVNRLPNGFPKKDFVEYFPLIFFFS